MTEPYLIESIFCEYSRHHCIRPKHGDYKYCLQHITEDKIAPYTSCQYVSRATKRKCPNPAPKPKMEKITMPILCSSHLQELLKKSNTRKKRKSKRRKMMQSLEPAQRAVVKHKHVLSKTLAKYADHETAIASDSSDFEEDDNGFTNEFTQSSLISTDGVDHIDSGSPVQNFDVMTDTEVLSVAQQKLVRLQSLYIEQFKSLNHELREARREFVVDSNKIIKGGKMDPVEEYHDNRRHGIEALLRLRYNRKRLQKLDKSSASQSGITINIRGELTSRCTHTEHHARCKGMSLPYTKYCSQHIMNDPHQQLYKECNWTNCKAAVCLLSSPSGVRSDDQNNVYCILHAPLPPLLFKMPKEIKEMIQNKTTIHQLGSSAENQCVDVESVETSPQHASTALTQTTESQNTPNTLHAAQHTDTPDSPQTTTMEMNVVSASIVAQDTKTQQDVAVSSVAQDTDNIPTVSIATPHLVQDTDKQSATSDARQNIANPLNTSESVKTLNQTHLVTENATEKVLQTQEKDIKKEIAKRDPEDDEKMDVDVEDCQQTTETKLDDGKDKIIKVENINVGGTAEGQQEVGGENSKQEVSNEKVDGSELGVKCEHPANEFGKPDTDSVPVKMETPLTTSSVESAINLPIENSNNTPVEKDETGNTPVTAADIPPLTTTDIPPATTTDIPPLTTTDTLPATTTDIPPLTTTDTLPATTTVTPAANQAQKTKESVDENSDSLHPVDTSATASEQDVLPPRQVADEVAQTVIPKTSSMPPRLITHQSILTEDSPQRKLSDEDIAVSSLLTLSAAAHSEASDC